MPQPTTGRATRLYHTVRRLIGAALTLALAASCDDAVPSAPAVDPALAVRIVAPSASSVDLSASVLQDIRPQDGVDMLALHGAIFLAIARNPDIAASADAIAGAELNVESALNALKWTIQPNLYTSKTSDGRTAGYSLGLVQPTAWGTTVGANAGTDYSTVDDTKTETFTSRATASVTQPLMRGAGRLVNLESVRRAHRSVDAAEAARIRLREQIIIETASAFYDIIEQRLIIRLREKEYNGLERLAAATLAKEKLGMASRFDSYRAEIQKTSATDSLSSATEALGAAEDRLRELLNVGSTYRIEPLVPTIVAPPSFDIDIDAARRFAEARRVDLIETRRQLIEDADAARRIAEHNVLPELNLTLSVGLDKSAEGFKDSTHVTEPTWSVGLSTDGDILRRNSRLAIERNAIDQRAARRAYLLARQSVFREVDADVRALKRAVRDAEIQKTSVRQIDEKRRFALARHQRGLVDNFELLRAEQELINAQLAEFRATRDIVLSRLRLLRSLGALGDLYDSRTLFDNAIDLFDFTIEPTETASGADSANGDRGDEERESVGESAAR
ncbi:MAG: TolC family protein [Planctomycetota bacterium]